MKEGGYKESGSDVGQKSGKKGRRAALLTCIKEKDQKSSRLERNCNSTEGRGKRALVKPSKGQLGPR